MLFRSQGKWLEDKIHEWINQRIPVYRVGIMIGAYVKNVNKDFSKFWIVNDSAFAGLLCQSGINETKKILLNHAVSLEFIGFSCLI